MMIGERSHGNPTVHVPPWCFPDDPMADNNHVFNMNSPNGNANNINSPNFDEYPLSALQRYLPSNLNDAVMDETGEFLDFPVDAYSCDQFRIYEFKVRKCTRGRSHDWTECPFAHPGEKARRRDPRKYHYSGTACPEFRKGSCRKGDFCEFAHGVFECWLHPARYRTQPCKDGLGCKRRVCFFAHSPEQLRVLSPRGSESYGGGLLSPHRVAIEGCCDKRLHFMSSPESSSPPSESPPMSPMTANSMVSRSLGSGSINDVVASLRQLQLNKVKSMPNSWGLQVGGSSGIGSPRMHITRPDFCSLPSTPTRAVNRPGIGYFDSCEEEGEPVMERVESGRGLRAKMFEKLSKENPLDPVDPSPTYAPNPDVEWVSDLIK